MGQYQQSDPVIELTFNYPDNLSLSNSSAQTGTITVQNKSQLPLSSTVVVITADDDIGGYDLQLLNNGTPASSLTINVGALSAGTTSIPYNFKFRIQSMVPHPPPASNPTITFDFLPAYEVKYDKTDSLSSTVATNIVDDNQGGGSYSGTETDTCTSDPVITFSNTPPTPVTYYSVSPSGTFGSTFSVTNNSNLPISDIQLQLDADDDSAYYNSQVTESVIDLGALAAGKTINNVFYWHVTHIPGTDAIAESFTTTLWVMPWYTVTYRNGDEVFNTGGIPVSP